MDTTPTEEDREYSTFFEPWALVCANSFLTGLISYQNRGGLRVRSFEVIPDEDVIVAVIEYYGNDDVPKAVVGYRFILSKLRTMAGENHDPSFAASLYLEDLAILPNVSAGSEPVDGVHWINRPGF